MQHSEIEVQRSPLMSLLLHPSGSCGDVPVTAAGAAPCCHITAPHSPQHAPQILWSLGSVWSGHGALSAFVETAL